MYMEKSIKLIKEVERTHAGLGIPILFSNIANYANVSSFFVGDMGTGKSTIVHSMKRPVDVKPDYDMNIYTLNMTTLIKILHNVKDSKLIWRISDWSTLQQYHRNIFLTIGSEIISGKNFQHISRSKDEEISMNIQNCELVCYIGIQPLKLSRMMGENENWESIAKDRFIKFALINPLRNDTVDFQPEYNFFIYPSPFPMKIESQLTVMKWVLKEQSSEERLISYCRKLINAYARFEGYETVTIKVELEFRKLFGVYLGLYSLLTYSTDIDREEKFSVGVLRLLQMIVRHNGLTYYDLLDRFKLRDVIENEPSYRRMIISKSEILKKAKLISIRENSPITFYMSKELQDFYDWYESIRR